MKCKSRNTFLIGPVNNSNQFVCVSSEGCDDLCRLCEGWKLTPLQWETDIRFQKVTLQLVVMVNFFDQWAAVTIKCLILSLRCLAGKDTSWYCWTDRYKSVSSVAWSVEKVWCDERGGFEVSPLQPQGYCDGQQGGLCEASAFETRLFAWFCLFSERKTEIRNKSLESFFVRDHRNEKNV